MKANLGPLDKAVRLITSVLIIILLISGLVSITIVLVGSILAIILITTSNIGYDPLYGICKINTKKRLNDKAFNSNKNQYYFNQ